MVDVNKDVVAALKTVLPTYFELFLDSSVETPCISYIESGNQDDIVTKEMGTSLIDFTIKIWAKDMKDIVKYTLLVDKKMRNLGFNRTSSTQMSYNNLICKVCIYEATGFEKY